MENLIVAAITGLSLFYILRTYYKKLSTKSSGCGTCEGCGKNNGILDSKECQDKS
ncbi:MAG: FeoB-associated Cys-rich membrane protein [Desulfobacterales bacterium]|nr:FeoB-associated Cys-rich membrane protein [Desulfobacterales bacterium]MCP4163528.1 FeoB-associated Cys-rich membrane protein [Deltaproteobacteria bacterium]